MNSIVNENENDKLYLLQTCIAAVQLYLEDCAKVNQSNNQGPNYHWNLDLFIEKQTKFRNALEDNKFRCLSLDLDIISSDKFENLYLNLIT